MSIGTQKLSIIVPVGIDKTLSPELIACITDSRLSSHQIILIVDQGMTDANPSTEESLGRLSTMPVNNIKIVYGVFNSPGMCRNEGLRWSNNDWIVFWDADDVPILEGLFAALEFAQQKNKDIVVSQAIRVDGNSHEHLIQDNWFGLLTWPGIWRILFNQKTINKKKFADWKWCEDQDFILNSFSSSTEIGWFGKVTYKYNQNVSGSTTQDHTNSVFLQQFHEKLRNPKSYQANVSLISLFHIKTLLALFRRQPRLWAIPLMIGTLKGVLSILLNLYKLR